MVRGGPPIAAHLGRPETPAETAARKARTTAAYRSSKTARNLVAALLVSLVIVLVMVWGVPRGEVPERPEPDVAAIAQGIERTSGLRAVVPAVPEGWRVNDARLTGSAPSVWTVALARTGSHEPGFVRVQHAFGADEAWTASELDGSVPSGVVTIEGREWREYTLSARSDQQVTSALATSVGADQVIVSGTSEPEVIRRTAASLSDELTELDRAS